MFNFFDPGKLIKNYYSKYPINLNNKNLSISIKLDNQIQNLKKLFLKHFCNSSDFFVAFFPAPKYVLELIKENIKNKKFVVFTDSAFASDFFSTENIFLIEELFSFLDSDSEKKHNIFIWINNKVSLDVVKKIIVYKEKYSNVLIYWQIDFFLYEDIAKILKNIDFFSFNPAFSLDVDGTVIFAYKKNYCLFPVNLGSTSATVNEDKTINVLSTCDAMNCGTSNFAILLLLEKYFFYLVKKKIEVLKIIQHYEKQFGHLFKTNSINSKHLINFNLINNKNYENNI